MKHSPKSTTDYSTETLTPKERELLKQLVDAELRVKALERDVEKWKAKLKRKQDDTKSLRHARRMLGNYQPAYLSKEEWQLIQEQRRVCE